MFRLTVRLMLVLMALFTLLSLIATTVGTAHRRTMSPAVSEADTRTTDCQLPCWGGITPGKTTFDDAAAILTRNLPQMTSPPTISGSLLNFGARINDQQISGVVDYNRSRVGSLRLNIAQPLAVLLDTLGTPTCVRGYQSQDGEVILVLNWQVDKLYVKTLLVTHAGGQIKPIMLTQDLKIGEDAAVCDPASQPWIGFAPAWRYLTDVPQ